MTENKTKTAQDYINQENFMGKDVESLPKWAQGLIQRLAQVAVNKERDISTLTAEGTIDNSRISIGLPESSNSRLIPSHEYATAYFSLNGFKEYYAVKLEDSGDLKIHSHSTRSRMVILPEVSNSITIRPMDRS